MRFRNNLYPPTPCINIAASNKPPFVSISGAQRRCGLLPRVPQCSIPQRPRPCPWLCRRSNTALWIDMVVVATQKIRPCSGCPIPWSIVGRVVSDLRHPGSKMLRIRWSQLGFISSPNFFPQCPQLCRWIWGMLWLWEDVTQGAHRRMPRGIFWACSSSSSSRELQTT